MFLGDLNLLFLFFFIIFGSILISTHTSLHFLLTAELIWITLYAVVLYVGFVYDNINLVSLTFFFLIFSAIELGLGLVLLLLQHILLRTLNLTFSDTNIFKNSSRLNRFLNLNRISFKV